MLNKSFYRLGLFVGRHPGYFLVVPVLLTMFFVTGFQRIKTNIDPEYLFSPVNGDGKYERAVVEGLFKMNYSTHFNVARITRAGEWNYDVLGDKGTVVYLHLDIFGSVDAMC